MNRTLFPIAALAAASTLAIGSTASAAMITASGGNNPRDTNNDLIGDGVVDPGPLNVGAIGNTGTNNQVGVVAFEVPILASGETFDTASLTFTYTGNNGAEPTDFNVDLYGLNRSPVNDGSGGIASDYFEGPLDLSNTLIANDFVTSADDPTVNISTTGFENTALVAFLNANPTTASDPFVLFRLNADGDVSEGGKRNFQFADNPTLTFTTTTGVIPEPASMALLGLGGLLLIGGRRRNA